MSSHPEPGPEAESTLSAVHASDNNSVARRSHRSCFLCNRRKVRCDKREPCGPCSRAGKQCTYPPAGEPIRRPRKTTMADVASRISHLEQSLVTSRNGDTPSSNQPAAAAKTAPPIATATTPYVSSSNSDTPKRPESVTGDGVLLQRGSTSQYFNEILLSRVIEEERDIQSVFTSPEERAPPLALSSPFNPMGILSAPSLSHTPASFYPPKQAVHRLWNLYVDYVECCSGLKVGHIPSMEVKIFTTLGDPSAAPLDDLALNYAVFFATLVSREDEEVVNILGGSRTAWLKQTKMGFEQALAHADFLDKPTATGLHAVAVYLSALTVHNRGKGLWILNGLAIRMAQSLGIHCNGERLGLSPFESELRRRLWWHFMNRDGRAGEDYGLQNTMNPVQSPDIQMPLNVEDTDLYPEMTALPPERKAFTAMTLSLNQIDIATASYKLTSLAGSPTLPPEEVRQQIIDEMKTRVEERLKYCNNHIPRQRHTICISRYVMRKINLITRQQWASLRCPGTREACATEEDLIDAIETLEEGINWVYDELLRPFMWVAKAYPQYNLMMYVLWHLCVRPEGPSIERAWQMVNRVVESQLWDKMREGVGSKGAVLDALYVKAKALREKKLMGEDTLEAQTQDGEGVQQALPMAATDGDFGFSVNTWPYAFGSAEGDGFEAIGEDGFPDWGSLVRGLQMNGPNFSEALWH